MKITSMGRLLTKTMEALLTGNVLFVVVLVALSGAVPLLNTLLAEALTAGRPLSQEKDQATAALRPSALSPAVYTYRIIKAYPHDRKAFTQGLVFSEGYLYEGTGLRGQSTLRKVELETGRVLRSVSLPAHFFGEGITIFGEEVIQLTWQSKVGFVYERDSFALKRSFAYATEGWGITHDGTRLIMSDGTATIRFLDPLTMKVTGEVSVQDERKAVRNLNELEYVEGKIYANVWRTDRIAIIDPASGRIEGWIDLEGLPGGAEREETAGVLNGIAYDRKGKRLFVTGKKWSRLFEIELVRRQ